MGGLNNLWFKSHEEIKTQSISNGFYYNLLEILITFKMSSIHYNAFITYQI